MGASFSGPVGPKGLQGIQGPIGPLGPSGPIGEPGVSNIPGPQGLIGLQGPIGLQGIQGLKGDQGIQGIQGLKGDQGIQGLVGPIGLQGIQGPIGDVSKDFMKANGMWCADGELCKIPVGKKGIDWGYGASKIFDDGQLKVSSDDNIFLQIGDYNTMQIQKDNVFLANGTALQFGQGFEKVANAGEISYGRYDGGVDGSLNIVGAGKNGQARSVRVWDTLRLGDATLRQDDDWLRIISDKNNNQSYDKGLAARQLWARDKIFASGRDILAELDDLRNNAVRKDKQYFVRSNRGGLLIDGGGWSGNKGDWETMKFEQK
jgi:hypothetical protein